MRLIKENISRRIDHLGRISIPKNIRARMCINDNSLLDCYTLEDDEGNSYICLTNHKEEVQKDEKVAALIKGLEELGVTVPDELKEME